MIKTFKTMPSWQRKILLGMIAALAVWLFGVFTGYTWIKYMALTMFPLAFCSRTFLWNLLKDLSSEDSVKYESEKKSSFSICEPSEGFAYDLNDELTVSCDPSASVRIN